MKSKFFLITTIPFSLNFFKGQIKELNKIFDVTLISSGDPYLTTVASNEGVRARSLNMKRNISLFVDIVSLFKLIHMFFTEKPKIIHCNTPKASFLALLAGYITHVPFRIYYIHGLRFEGYTGLKRYLLIYIEKISCFCATDIIAVSFGVKQIAEQMLTRKKVTVLHNGSPNGILINEYIEYNYDKDGFRKELGILETDFVFGFVGRIVGDKGINELIDAFTRLSKIHVHVKLLLIGYYEERLDPLNKTTKSKILEDPNIIYMGFQQDVKKYLSVLDVFVSPSYREGFGLTLLEANLMGIPLIATSITGYTEIIQDGYNGFLIPSKNTLALFIKMKEMIEDKASIIGMKDNCRSAVLNKYNHENVLEKALEYYKKIDV